MSLVNDDQLKRFDFNGGLEPNLTGLENAIRCNYVLHDDGEAEAMEALKSIEGSKSAPQLMQVFLGYRMGYSEQEIKNHFGVTDKMYDAIWKRIRYLLTKNDQYFINKVKLCQNYLRLVAR